MIPAVARTDRRKPASIDPGGIDKQQHRCTAQPSAAAAVPGPAELAREQRHARHRARADDGRRRPDERDVDDDRDRGQDRPPPPLQPARERAERRGDDRDVPARDRDDVARAGVVNAAARSRSTRSRRPISTPAASPASGSGHGPIDAVGGGAAEALERPLDRARRPGAARARRPAASRRRRSWRGTRRSRPRAAAGSAATPRRGRPGTTGGIPRQRRRDDAPAAHRASSRTSPVARRLVGAPDGLDRADPRPVAGRDRGRTAAGDRRRSPRAGRSRRRRSRAARARRGSPRCRPTGMSRDREQQERRDPASDRDRSGASPIASAPAAAPTASHAGRGTSSRP